MIRLSSIVLAVLAALATGLSGWLLLTTTGAEAVVSVARRYLELPLDASGWSGNLVQGLCVDGFRYQTPALSVDGESVCVVANLWESIDFVKVSFSSLQATRLSVVTSGEDSDGDRNPPFLPIAIELSQGSVIKLVINGIEIESLSTSLALRDTDIVTRAGFRYQSYLVEVATSGPWDALALAGSVALPDVVEVKAVVDLTDARMSYQLDLTSERLALAEWIDRAVELEQTRIKLDGDLDAYDFEVSGMVTDAISGVARVLGRGRGDFAGVEMQMTLTGELDAPGVEKIGRMDVDGQFGWTPETTFDLSVSAEGVEVADEHRRLETDGTFRVSGKPDALDVEAQLGGVLNGQTLSATVRSEVRWPQVRVDAVDVRLGEGMLAGSGHVTFEETPDVSLALQMQDLDLTRLDDRITGVVTGDLQVDGNYMAPEISGWLRALGLAYDTYRVGTLNLEMLPGDEPQLQFEAMALETSNQQLDEITGTLTGDLEGGRLQLAVQAENYRAEGQFSYLWQDPRLTVDISRLLVDLEESGAGRATLVLESPAQAEYSSGNIEVSDLCLHAQILHPVSEDQTSAEVCTEFRYPDGGLQLTVRDLGLPPVSLPDGSSWVQGLLNLQAEVVSFSPIQGSMHIDLDNLTVFQESKSPRGLGSLELLGRISDSHASVDLNASQGELGASGTLSSELQANLMSSPIEGRLVMNLDAIWPIEHVLPMDLVYELDQMQGSLQLTAEVSGTLNNPLLNGEVIARDAGWFAVPVGAGFSGVNLKAQLIDSDRMSFQSSGAIGTGGFLLHGTIDGMRSDRPVLEAQLALEGSQIVDLPDYSARMDGTVRVVVERETLTVSGDLALPSALLRIRDLPETAVSASPDEVLVGQSVEAPEQVRNTDVRLDLGDDVQLQAFGLDTRLKGSLRVIETPGEPPVVQGTIVLVDGRFEAYGQKLTVERGALTFSGPVDNPAVSVVASRFVDLDGKDYKVSMILSGTAQSLATTVTSDPGLPESDALALLVSGRTFSQMSNSEQTSVYGAAISLGLYGALGLGEQMGSVVGLEEIILEQDAEGNYEVGAAVRINQDLYLRYTYSVFSRLGGVLLRYRLNRRFSVQAHAGDAQSIEIRYGVDE